MADGYKAKRNTLILLTADHAMVTRALRAVDAGMRMSEFDFLTAMLYVPGNERWRGQSTATLCTQLDVAPTILDMMDVDVENPFLGLSIFSERPRYPLAVGREIPPDPVTGAPRDVAGTLGWTPEDHAAFLAYLQALAAANRIRPVDAPASAATGTTGATGGTLSVTMTASATTCGWTASSNAAWATVAPTSGTGTRTLGVTVAANTGAARTATVTIGGQAYVVTQAAAPPSCTFALSTASVSGNGPGGSSSVTLTASASTCTWTASTTTSWITMATAGGTGSGLVSFTLARNSTGAVRTGTVTAGGKALTVTQTSVAPPSQPKNLQVKGK